MSIKYLGHSAFEITLKSEDKILIDPFLVMSPDYKPEGVTDIFVTHAHADHLGSAIEISKQTGATITAVFELANYCQAKGAKVNGINLGGWINYDWGRVLAVPAFHSSSTADGVYGGCACGYIIETNGGYTLYHAGDTCLNINMKMIGEIYEPDVAMLPIGGHYTMDIEQAAIASEWLGASAIIPMHYNTFETINVDINEFERQIREKGKMPILLQIGVDFNY